VIRALLDCVARYKFTYVCMYKAIPVAFILEIWPDQLNHRSKSHMGYGYPSVTYGMTHPELMIHLTRDL